MLILFGGPEYLFTL